MENGEFTFAKSGLREKNIKKNARQTSNSKQNNIAMPFALIKLSLFFKVKLKENYLLDIRQLLQCDFTMRFERVGGLQIIQWEG